MPMAGTTTNRYYSKGPTPSWNNRGKSEEERRGIAVSVAVNNVFGNLTFDQLQDLTLNGDKLTRLFKLVEDLAKLQVRFASATENNVG